MPRLYDWNHSAVDSSDFYITETSTDPWGTTETTRLRTELLDQVVAASSSTWSDLEVAGL